MLRHIIELLSGLEGRFSHSIAASQKLYRSLPQKVREKVEFVPTDIGDSIGPAALVQAAALATYIRRRNMDIVHSHGYKAAIPGVIAAKFGGARSVITGHNLFPERASLAARLSIRFAARSSDKIIAVAPALARSLTKAGVDEHKIEVIYNGIDLSGYTARGYKSRLGIKGIAESSPVIFCGARLTEVKGVEYLIRAAKGIAEQMPDARILIAGDGPDREQMIKLARETAPEMVILLGYRNDVPALIAASDVVVIPSIADGHPLMVVEAMASGKPVVASAVGGLADVIRDGENGLLVPPADPTAIARAVLRVISSPELCSSLGTSARAYASAEFSVDKMLASIEEVYLCVVS